MDDLDALENKSIYVIREAYQKFKGRIAFLWSVGKDSTTMLWLARKAFFGHSPIPVIPIVDLYRSKGGTRFRSIGCTHCCSPVESIAASIEDIIHEIEHSRESERAGRAQDKENLYTMQKLRSLGYM